jgi:protein-S-isoprenylcysteine O-methyltransferase Ste14
LIARDDVRICDATASGVNAIQIALDTLAPANFTFQKRIPVTTIAVHPRPSAFICVHLRLIVRDRTTTDDLTAIAPPALPLFSQPDYPRGMEWISPAVLLALTISFYWGRVVKLVLKTRRTTGKSAHFLPPEPLGRVLRIIWYPTVAAWVIVPWLVVLGGSGFGLNVLFWLGHVHWLFAALCVVVLYLTMICWRKMGRDWRMGIDPNEKNNLIVSGPYARVRHPIYALQILLVWLSFLTLPAGAMLVVAILQTILLTWEAVREEQHLINQHGDTYRNYIRSTGRFFPRLGAAPASA